MGEFFLGIIEITLGMTILILLMLPVLKYIGGKFTAKCRYILWTLVLMRLAVPMSFGILPVQIEVPVETTQEPSIRMQTVPNTEYIPVQQQNSVPTQPQTPVLPVEKPVFTEPETKVLTWQDVKGYIPHLYLAGAAVFFLWNLLTYGIYTGKILRSARAADPEAQTIYEAVCRKKELHRPPLLLISPDVNSPAAFGLVRRRIVLPDIELTENGLAGTLSHEVTHCKRGDLWIKAVCLLARSFHWFNPLVHLAALRCEMEMELSCDESVLAGCSDEARTAYGEVMLDIIRRCRRNRGALTTHFNPKKNAVKARFTNILYGSGKKQGLWLIAVCLVLCLIAGAVVACRTETEKVVETTEEEQNEILLDSYEQYQTEYNDLQAQLGLLNDKFTDLTASNAELQTELQSLTASRENLQTQLAGISEDSEEALHLRLTIQEYDERIKSYRMAMNGIDSEIALLESQRQTIQEKLQALENSRNGISENPDSENSDSLPDADTAVSTDDPDTLWQTFLDTVVSPYTEYIVATEFLDLDGNGIDELIIYNWGASANCGIEIFTIENGEVRSFSTGTSVITHYSGEAKSLAPPSADAVDFGFWGLPTSYADKSDTILWFTPCAGRKGHVLYSMNGSDVHTSEDYYYFTSDANGNLTVEVLRSFLCEAIDSSPVNGWNCYIFGEEVSVRGFRDTMGALWQELAETQGVQYSKENTASRYDELGAWVEESVEDIVLPEEPNPNWLVDIHSEPYTYTYDEWIQYSLYTDFGFRDSVDVSALTDDELTTYMADAYQCALDIYFLFEVNSDRMYARTIYSSTMPHVEIDGRQYTQMCNPVFPTLADLESYMNGVLSPELTKKLLSMGMFIDYEGELYGMMGARGTNISMKTIGFSVTSRTDTQIIYTAEVEVREYDPGAEEPDYVEYYDFTYALTEDGWRWTDFYLYN